MTDKAELLKRLQGVMDPELGMNIVELGMVRGLEVQNGRVKLTLALTVSNCPLSRTIVQDVKEALLGHGGIKDVAVTTTTMTKGELEELRLKLERRRGERPGLRIISPQISKLQKKGIQRVISIVSGKGGVGKSFVTAMLAVEFRRMGYTIGILDADVTGPSIAKAFGLDERLRGGPNGVEPAVTRTGIKVVSTNLLLDDPKTATIWRGPIINNVIRQFYTDVNWGQLHYLFVDLPPGTSDAPLTVYQSFPVDGAILVSTPQDLAFMVVGKARDMAKQMGIPIYGMIENMSYYACSGCGKKEEIFGPSRVAEVAKASGLSVLGRLPLDPRVSMLADAGQMEDYEDGTFSEVAREFRRKTAGVGDMSVPPAAWSKEGRE